jgi:hypothetical protein
LPDLPILDLQLIRLLADHLAQMVARSILIGSPSGQMPALLVTGALFRQRLRGISSPPDMGASFTLFQNL